MAAQRVVLLPGWLFPTAVLAFTLLPLVELALLVWLGQSAFGLWPTLALCASTGFVGAWLARQQGFLTLLKAQQAMQEGRFPGGELLDGAFLLVGGVVLLTPGLLTDAVGFFLLLPPTRALLKRGARAYWARLQAKQQGIIDV